MYGLIETFCTELQAPRLAGGDPRFGNSAMDPPVPVAVKAQRRQLGWSTKERLGGSFLLSQHCRCVGS